MIKPNPTIDINLPWYVDSTLSRSFFRRSFLCIPQIKIDAIAAPSTIVCPTYPGNLAPASGKKINSEGPAVSNNAGSILTSPAANTNASSTRCPSTLERTLLVTVYVPSVSGGVVTARE